MNSMQNIYNAFTNNFLKGSILYLPKHVVNLIDKKKIKEDLIDFSNRIFIIEIDGGNYFVDDENNSCVIHILKKRTLLEDNIYQLLTLKADESLDTFNYVLEKYLKQLAGYIYCSHWFCLNAESDIDNLTKEILNALELQHNNFKAHQEEIFKRFNKNKDLHVAINLEEIKQDGINTLGELINDKNLNKGIKYNSILITKRERKKACIKDLKVQTIKTVDVLILNNVFGLKIETKDELTI